MSHVFMSLYRKLAKASLMLAMASLVAVSIGIAAPQEAKAQDDPMVGDTYAPYNTLYLCARPVATTAAAAYIGPISMYDMARECHYYDLLKARIVDARGTIQMIIVRALSDVLFNMVVMVGQQTAQWMVDGFHGKPAFWKKGFLGFIKDVGMEFTNRFIDTLDKQWGLGLCQPINLNLKLSLAIGTVAPIPPPDCTFEKVKNNFENVYRQLEPSELVKTLAKNTSISGNDFDFNLRVRSMYLSNKSAEERAAEQNRVETKGLKHVTVGPFSQDIKTPAKVIDDTIAQTNQAGMFKESGFAQANSVAMQAMWANLKQLPVVAGMAFITTLARGALQKLLDYILNPDSQDDTESSTIDLTDPFAQKSAEPKQQTRARAFTDIIAPNLMSADQIDVVSEMAACPDVRGFWNCTMDEALASAVKITNENGGNTVMRAAGLGGGGGTAFLHTDWELIPVTETKDDQDPGCYQRAYCASNLAKMRFARIIPLGWELAANSPFNLKNNGKYVTLGQVLRGFNDCNKDNALDAEHPWCHLIDPAWVLTSPPVKCQLKGYGDSLFVPEMGMRQQECSDIVSCLSRNDKGECQGGYGYCLAEKTVWRFGADSCDEKFVSCRTYTSRAEGPRQGAEVSFVRNSVDYGACNQDNVGCMFYAALHDVSTTSTNKWVTKATFDGKIVDLKTTPRIYFDSKVEACDAANEGCTKVLRVEQGQPALNLVRNGSFENVLTSQNDKLDGWLAGQLATPATADLSGSPGEDIVVADTGYSAQRFSGAKKIHQNIEVGPVRNYALAFSAKADDGAAPHKASVSVVFYNKLGQKVASGQQFYRSLNCNALFSGVAEVDLSLKTGANVGADNLGTDWTRYTCEFVTNNDAATAKVVVGGENAIIDSIQLEEGDKPTDFVDGDNSALKKEYLKLPPQEYACSGDEKNDRKECASFAKTCNQTEAGCQGYTEIGGGDQTEIPALVSSNDLCPKTCVGYAEYRKLPSAFDLVKTGSADPLNDPLDDPADDTVAAFVPKSSKACTAAEAGCEQFTNVESAAQGGESTLYLTYARACEKPSVDRSRTYFTWEGSDTTGYQLKTWSLIKSDTPDPNMHYPPKVLRKLGPDGILKDPANCTAEAWKLGEDSDCRQFYDEQGQAFYAYYSQTVVSSEECRDYRKNNSDSADCSKTGGQYRPDTGDCIYSLLAAESAQCSQANTGCRGYMGTTGRNTVNVFTERFSAATSSSFYTVSGQGTTLKISPEALLVGDNSLQVQQAQGNGIAKFDFPSTTNTLYTVSFWMKTVSVNAKPVKVKLGADEVGTFQPSVDWKRFELGPFRAKGSPVQTLSFEGLPTPTYLDEVTVTRQQDVVYVVKDSWNIPAECDQTIEGIPQPRAMLGCREYRDRTGKLVDVRQFSRLCRYAAIGCTSYVDTRDSDSAYADTFTLNGLDPAKLTKAWDKLYAGNVSVVRPADRYVYVIDEPSAHCDSTETSCRSFGKPVFDAYGAPSSTFETVYLKDDINKYVDGGGEPDMLCRPDELNCEKFVSGPVTSYFREPGLHVCEWKDKVKVASSTNPYWPDGEYSGWFIKDKEPATPCYPDKQSGGNSFLTEFAAAPNYRGWVNECPSDQSECTEFRDPNDHSDQSHPTGKPYFFINNTSLDKKSCNGQVDPLSGCVLFRDMNNSQLSFNSSATYAKSHTDGDVATGPINCKTDTSNPYCQNRGTCQNLRLLSCASDGCSTDINNSYSYLNWLVPHTGAACTTDKDCYHYEQPQGSTGFEIQGTCDQNDANLILKVKLDRDCQTWLGCSSAETVYDPAQQKYIDLCTNLSACDQAGGAASKNFCGHYVDRASDATKLMAQGRFLDISSYIKRPTGLGETDYAGYSIPNHFQTSDLMMRRVAYEMLVNRPGPQRDSLYNDFRLVAAVPMTDKPDCVAGQPTCADPWYAVAYKDNVYPYLNLCKHNQTGLIGYRVDNDARCFLPIEKPYSTVLNEALGQFLGLPGNAQKAATAFEGSANSSQDANLNRHYPPVECRAHPESNSPFPNSFVKQWDLASEPPVPKSMLDGYDKAFYCEYGEDCDCSYRKVEYQGRIKYYSAFAGTAPAGVCVGGTDEGKACDPGVTVDSANQQNQAAQDAAAKSIADNLKEGQAQGQSQTSENPGGKSTTPIPAQCRNGSCQPYDKDTFVRGVVGQCLERDFSRKLGGALDKNPCLIWNPAPVLAGQQDRYHYEPQAGYLPPASSGDYYCLSKARAPRLNKSQANATNASWVMNWWTGEGSISSAALPAGDQKLNLVKTPPGKISRFEYHECYVMDTDVARDDAMPWGYDSFGTDDDWYEANCGWGATLDGVRANGGESGAACSGIRLAYGGGDLPGDTRSGRWITTGRGLNRNYAEYFVEFNPLGWTQWLLNSNTLTDEKDPRVAKAALEQNFTSFVFKPMYKTGVGGSWGCGMSGWWTDEFNVEASGNGWNKAANTMITKIMADFKPLTPENYGFLKNEAGTKLVRLPCKYPENGDSSEGEAQCYYKYWETGYHSDGQKMFRTFYDSMGGPRALNPADVTFAEAEGDKPFFAIRAMFEDTSPEDNKVPEFNMDPSGTQLSGPFRFVGWWITTSFPAVATERYIYMTMDVNHADICKQVARTSSPTSHEAAAFTDRIWDGGAFSIPKLGYNFNTEAAPFGSAKHAKEIGRDPLYQLGPTNQGPTFKMAGNRPTFLASGASYSRTSAMPLGNWAYLNNVFAKIYNVYNYHDMPVGKTSWACVAGPNFGTRCPNLDLLTQNWTDPNTDAATYTSDTSKKYCGYSGKCNPEMYDIVNDKESAFCNALSGVNAGLPCSASLTPSGYHVCHAAPVKNVNGELIAQYKPCGFAPGWVKNDGDNDLYTYQGTDATVLADCVDPALGGAASCKNLTRKTAAKSGAFHCASGAVKFPDGSPAWCRQPSGGSPSMDCPLEVGPHLAANAEGYSTCDKNLHRCTNGFEHTYCNEVYDCTFWWSTWWYLDMTKAGGQPSKPMPFPAKHATTASPYTPGWMQWYPSGVSVNFNYPLNGHGYPTGHGKSVGAWWTGTDIGYLSTDGQKSHLDIAGNNLTGSRYMFVSDNPINGILTLDSTKRFPGAFLAEVVYQSFGSNWDGLIIPGHCERLPMPTDKCKETKLYEGKTGTDPGGNPATACVEFTPGVPYFKATTETLVDTWITVGRWQGPDTMEPGLCEGGILDGRFCAFNSDCRPLWVTDNMDTDSGTYCKKVSDNSGNPASGQVGVVNKTSYNCLDPKGSKTASNADEDNNACTHGVGYYPKADLCGGSLTKSECLTGIRQYDAAASAGNESYNLKSFLPPTDVSAGLHLPPYIAQKNGKDQANYTADFSYLSYYAPRPPTMAAPDTARQCASAGQCQISQVGTFSLDGMTEGKVAYVGGQSVNTIRFYGWAADNQMGIKDIWVDWGDNSMQEFHDSRMKNKKPICGASKECEFVPGLTCNSNNDCPPAAGKCNNTSFCTSKPNIACKDDVDCYENGLDVGDKCSPRLTFGNSDRGCEQNYFEYTHVYLCPKESKNKLPACGVKRYCSRDNTQVCVNSSNCATGDTCLSSVEMAPPGGCYDANNNACRFTPRVILKDSWGWCSGECRVEDLGSGKLGMGFGGVNNVLLPNGGCYDATGIMLNRNSTEKMYASGTIENMCDPNPKVKTKSFRPWTLFKGALQLGITQ